MILETGILCFSSINCFNKNFLLQSAHKVSGMSILGCDIDNRNANRRKLNDKNDNRAN